ncbi:hypothetical protein MGU_07865 [Metarhizium guizhouense ARSEF 977]|uniref:DUF7770 domain-containing protein n=1 Tax=Metarhizium guizhouense (strain ARSEF 977) TaxID=1276136 RepID=A0A0B4GQJ4_METGA|nr:hypothetical protein MGU_07865 [Metarhizium guizhouense ARSEF 977]
MAHLTHSEDGYNLTQNPFALPQRFMQVVICSQLYVEFLKTTSGGEPIEEKKKAANHAVFKIVFAEKYDGYEGIRIDMTPNDYYKSGPDSIDGSPVKYQPGFLRVNAAKQTRPSTMSLCTCRLSIEPNWTVGRVIRLLLDYRASLFDFVDINYGYFGCRDFVTQAIYLMHNHGFIQSTEIRAVLSGPALPITSIYDALGLRFDYRGRISACPIDKGRFTSLQRYQSPSMPYQGSQRALELAHLIAR